MPTLDLPKTVVISGGTRGIGLATALRFSHAGWRVALLYRQNKTAAEHAAALLPTDRTLVLQADVSRADEVEAAANKIRAAFGSVDAVVNNAGVSHISLFSETTEDNWDTVIDNNLKSVFLLTRAFLPDMYEKKQGRIINLSSVWGVEGGSMEVAYSAAKAGVIGLTKGLAKEVGLMGITVNAVAPGFIDTEMNAEISPDTKSDWAESTALGRIGKAEEVANVIYFLASEEASYITGQTIEVNGGR